MHARLTRRLSVLVAIGALAAAFLGILRCQKPFEESTTDSAPAGVWLERTFEAYTSTDQLRSDCDSWKDCAEDWGKEKIYLDTNVAYAEAGLTRSMRYDYVDQGCESIMRGRGFRFPNSESEVWVELALRFSDNFTTANSACPPSDMKLMFGLPWSGGRWALHIPTWTMLGAVPVAVRGKPFEIQFDQPSQAYFDGSWHVWRWHIRRSTTTTSNDGVFEVWVDGVKLPIKQTPDFGVIQPHDYTGWSTDGQNIAWFQMSANKDKGRDVGTERLWIGYIRVWNGNPGWPGQVTPGS